MVRGRFGWWATAAIWVVAVTSAAAEQPAPPRDVDAWHRELMEAAGGCLTDERQQGWDLGLYPSLGVVLGPPDWAAIQANAYVSLTAEDRISVFVGYGYERGFNSETHMATFGWGGTRRLTAGRDQRGFYGKFLRYRRIEDFEHGIHRGLSVGIEHGVGAFGLSVEFGAARSHRDHWSPVVQLGIKVALPIVISLSGAHSS